jgi:hypothetical protein
MNRTFSATRVLSVVFLLALAGTASAEVDGRNTKTNDQLLENLVGTWDATGQVRGRAVENVFTASWVLNHQFVELHLLDKGQPPQYEAILFLGLDHMSERYVVHWIDVFGGRASETLGFGVRADNSMKLMFEYPDGPFRDTFAWSPAKNTWHFLLETKNDEGKWFTFAEYDLRRARADK